MARGKRGNAGGIPGSFISPEPTADIFFQALMERIRRYLQDTGRYSDKGIDIFDESLLLLPCWAAWKEDQKRRFQRKNHSAPVVHFPSGRNFVAGNE